MKSALNIIKEANDERVKVYGENEQRDLRTHERDK
jgi:hypothetical protein